MPTSNKVADTFCYETSGRLDMRVLESQTMQALQSNSFIYLTHVTSRLCGNELY
jgi:hypothetical protein